MKKGDIVFTAPNTIMFKLIRWWTKDQYGHVALCVGHIGKEPIIIEATARGIDVNAFKWRSQIEEPYAIYRIPKLSEKKAKVLASKSMEFVGSGYDFKTLLNFIYKKPKYKNDKKFICSELIFRILVSLKYLEADVEKPEMVSPVKLREILEEYKVAKCIKKVNYDE